MAEESLEVSVTINEHDGVFELFFGKNAFSHRPQNLLEVMGVIAGFCGDDQEVKVGFPSGFMSRCLDDSSPQFRRGVTVGNQARSIWEEEHPEH